MFFTKYYAHGHARSLSDSHRAALLGTEDRKFGNFFDCEPTTYNGKPQRTVVGPNTTSLVTSRMSYNTQGPNFLNHRNMYIPSTAVTVSSLLCYPMCYQPLTRDHSPTRSLARGYNRVTAVFQILIDVFFLWPKNMRLR